MGYNILYPFCYGDSMLTSTDDQFLFVEKYRPKTIDECILPDSIKNTFKEYVKQGKLPTFLLTGSAGVGKTTIAKALCNEVGADYIMINGSDEGRKIDTFRTIVKDFASSVSLSDAKKVVIVDEADYMNCFDANQTVKIYRDDEIINVPISQLDGKEATVVSIDSDGVVTLETAYGVCSGESEVFEVEFEDGSVMYCTKDHPFFNEDMQEQKIGVGEILFDINNIDITSLIYKNGNKS